MAGVQSGRIRLNIRLDADGLKTAPAGQAGCYAELRLSHAIFVQIL